MAARAHWPSLGPAARPLPHRRRAAVGTLLLLAGHVLASQQSPHTGVFETCPACRLNAMPELKRFLHESVLKQEFERLSVKFIPGMTPTLITYDEAGKEVSREVVDAKLDYAALGAWVEAKGFTKRATGGSGGGAAAGVAVASAATAAGTAGAAQQPAAAAGSTAGPAPIPPAAGAHLQEQQRRRRRRRRRVRQMGLAGGQQQPGAHLQHRRRRPRGDPGPGPGGAL